MIFGISYSKYSYLDRGMRRGRPVYLIANFGGPRNLNEIKEFLVALLNDQEVIRTSFPAFIHKWFFTRVAKKRAKRVEHDYKMIGGRSPIYEDTEAIAKKVALCLDAPVFTFHRYLPAIHPFFIEAMSKIPQDREIRIFPMFGQFSYATTGSIALWFCRNLPGKVVQNMRWIKSYPAHAAYLSALEECIRDFLYSSGLNEKRTILLFSAHGVPKRFITTGDIYEKECEITFRALTERFPQALSRICYQSQFGNEEWIRPYTDEVCRDIASWGKGYENAVIVPLSFTSDHIETLFEIEKLYLPVIQQQGFNAFRCPALNQREKWIKAIASMMQDSEDVPNHLLLRKP